MLVAYVFLGVALLTFVTTHPFRGIWRGMGCRACLVILAASIVLLWPVYIAASLGPAIRDALARRK